VALRVAELTGEYALAHLRPGTNEQALACKPAPAFQLADWSRISLILVPFECRGEQDGRGAWIRGARESFDYAAPATPLH